MAARMPLSCRADPPLPTPHTRYVMPPGPRLRLSRSRYASLGVFVAAVLLAACSEELPFFWGWDAAGDAATGDTGTSDAATGDAGFDAGGREDSGVRDVVEDGGETGAPDPCDDVRCGPHQQCREGRCECPDGSIVSGSECVEPSAEDPRTRTREQVCARWTGDYGERASRIHSAGSARCDPGTIDADAHDDAMRRLNLYRWLVGLAPASTDWGNQELAQYAAVMFDAQGNISHEPPPSWSCWSAEGAEAAGNSNIALGYRSPASTVDGYVGDEGVPSLGHRRWCLSPDLDDVGFGHYGRGGAMWAFGSTRRARVLDFVAYPPPGPVPASIAPGEWSFSRDSGLQRATVTVHDVARSQAVDVSATFKPQGYGQDTLGWTMPRAPRAGDAYTVSVDASGGSWEYEVTFVACP